MLYKNRHEAGQALAPLLKQYIRRPDVVVLGLPRGGVPVAFEVAQALNAPLDVFIVRKLGALDHEELAIGAIASGGVRVLNEEIMRTWHINPEQLAAITRKEQQELERREHAYRDGRPMPTLGNKIVLLVDDGLATGASMRAAVLAVRQHHPARIVVAVPAAAPSTCDALRGIAEEVICAATPEPFYAVGMWYDNFSQTSDEEVRILLGRAYESRSARV